MMLFTETVKWLESLESKRRTSNGFYEVTVFSTWFPTFGAWEVEY